MEKLDKHLNGLIENKTLSWLPWVGKKYIQAKEKLLIVGESHYYNPNEQGSIDKHGNINFTRIVINDIGIKKEYKKYKDKRTARLFPNLHKTVFGDDKTDSSALWDNVAFYNFVQVPMHSNKKRPTTKEIYAGWDSFFEVIKILQPDRVLFIGVEVLKKFEIYSKRNGIKHSNLKYHKITDKQVSRHFEIDFEKKIISIDSIKHCSQHYSIELWREYLKTIRVFDFVNS